MASMRCLERGADSIIPVILDNLYTMEKTPMPNTLNKLLKKSTYIPWPEHQNQRHEFWRNLHEAIAGPEERTLRCACGQSINLN